MAYALGRLNGLARRGSVALRRHRPPFPLPKVVEQALRLMDPLRRTENSEGTILLRIWGCSGNDQMVVLG